MEIVNRELLSKSKESGELRIIKERTEEFDIGWVFYYQSARFLETGNFSNLLVGNAPFFVARSDGQIFPISYHRPINESLAAYRACGNPNAHEVPEVVLTGWKTGAAPVSAIQAIRQHSSIGLGEAKQVIDDCLASQKAVVVVNNVPDARALIASLASSGFVAESRYDG
ncbi:MAG: YrhB family protein [Pseudomonadota bacterium]|nr:YrhB family protein [Pseudomonadota bacterium]